MTYVRQGEGDHKSRSDVWNTAIGLQKVDGLVPSQYLIDAANLNIEGKISLDQVREMVESYYQEKDSRKTSVDRQEEADKVSSRIAELISTNGFTLSPAELTSIHKYLFGDIYDFAGQIRDYNISKKEWVLDGVSVDYGDFRMLSEIIQYDLSQERDFDYTSLSPDEAVRHFTRFIANLWQIHPFGEGNTRTIAVFAIKYLHKLGFNVDNTPFKEHSWYFRNALVRANHANFNLKIKEDITGLEKFFGNLLLGEQNPLHNRDLHITNK